MYTRASTSEMKQKVLNSFVTVNGKLRVVIATTAFSMGIDCPDIRTVVHFGTPSTVEEYVQESGHADRDSNTATARMLYGKPPKGTSAQMKSYGKNKKECRRKLLFKNFLFSSENNDEYRCVNVVITVPKLVNAVIVACSVNDIVQ